MRVTTIAVLLAAAAALACSHRAERRESGTETGDVGGSTAREAVPEGEAQRSQQSGKALAEQALNQWKRDHPEVDWVAEEAQKHQLQEPADNSKLIGRGQGATYSRISEQDVATWSREVKKAVAEGSRIFHSAEELGSPIAVSCDMCHPDAANTHAETYPKFQVQMGRVAHLRDMINWCIEQPVRGPPLDPDSPKMRALEAYLLAQRKGVPLDYGRR